MTTPPPLPPGPPLPPDELPLDAKDFTMPSIEDLLKALEGMEGISEEDKQQLKDTLMNRNREGSNGLGNGDFSDAQGDLASDFVILVIFLMVIVLIFVFFGYKLYKSLSDRERRREEKRRQKQQKKKK